MTERQELELRQEVVDTVINFLADRLMYYYEERWQLTMKLNRLRRLEREELQNDTD